MNCIKCNLNISFMGMRLLYAIPNTEILYYQCSYQDFLRRGPQDP